MYRTIELSNGWNGRIISTQVLFSTYLDLVFNTTVLTAHALTYLDVLDGAMVTLAIYTVNIAHPGWLLGSKSGFVKSTRPIEKSENE